MTNDVKELQHRVRCLEAKVALLYGFSPADEPWVPEEGDVINISGAAGEKYWLFSQREVVQEAPPPP